MKLFTVGGADTRWCLTLTLPFTFRQLKVNIRLGLEWLFFRFTLIYPTQPFKISIEGKITRKHIIKSGSSMPKTSILNRRFVSQVMSSYECFLVIMRVWCGETCVYTYTHAPPSPLTPPHNENHPRCFQYLTPKEI